MTKNRRVKIRQALGIFMGVMWWFGLIVCILGMMDVHRQVWLFGIPILLFSAVLGPWGLLLLTED